MGPRFKVGDKVKFAPSYPDTGYFGKEKKAGDVFTVDTIQKNDDKKTNPETGKDIRDGGTYYLKLKEIKETHLLKSDDFVKVKGATVGSLLQKIIASEPTAFQVGDKVKFIDNPATNGDPLGIVGQEADVVEVVGPRDITVKCEKYPDGLGVSEDDIEKIDAQTSFSLQSSLLYKIISRAGDVQIEEKPGYALIKIDKDADFSWRGEDKKLEDVEDSVGDAFGNTSFNWVAPEDVGALTDAPMFGDVEIHDDGTVGEVHSLYWYPDYQLKDWREELLEKGEVKFPSGMNEAATAKVTAADRPRPSDSLPDVKAGDICLVTEKPRGGKAPSEADQYLILVLATDKELGKGNKGFYYTGVDDKKEIIDDYGKPNVSHSNSLTIFGAAVKVVEHEPLQKHSFKGHTWYLTGNDYIDQDKMPNLDGRSDIFDEYAPKNIKEIYARQEDQNYHQENCQMVNDFCDWCAGGKDPKAFQYTEDTGYQNSYSMLATILKAAEEKTKEEKETEAAEESTSARPEDKTAEARTWKESLDEAKKIYPDAEKLLQKMGKDASEQAHVNINLKLSDDENDDNKKLQGVDCPIPYWLAEDGAFAQYAEGTHQHGKVQEGLAITALRELAAMFPDVKAWMDDPKHGYLSYGESSGHMPYHHAKFPNDAILIYVQGQDDEEEIQEEVSQLAKRYGKKDVEEFKKFLKLVSDESLGIVYRYDGADKNVELYERMQYVIALYFKLPEVLKVVNAARKQNKNEEINQDTVKGLIEDLKKGAGDWE